jgi:hypothetical protein
MKKWNIEKMLNICYKFTLKMKAVPSSETLLTAFYGVVHLGSGRV